MSLKQKYNADYYHDKAAQALEAVTSSEVESWYLHPCTESLVLMLEGDLANLVSVWKDGGFTAETADKTLQMNSKAIGACQCIDAVLDHIREIRRRDVGESQ